MSYLVLARKWRPQAFEDVTGQEHVVRTLANAIAQDRVAHAFLLCGPRGVGKTTTARLLARALNCESGPTATPCGTCTACREIVAGSSVDVVEIDGASNNGVDDVRELRESARYLPQRDRHKIFIIDEVHMLSIAAFNALLKTLEEPPPHVKFIFATTDPQKLPDTILSRCQRHNFKRVSIAQMAGRLRTICDAEGVKISDGALALLSRQADGGMRDALSLLDQLLSSSGLELSDEAVAEALGIVDRSVVHALAQALVDRDGRAVIELTRRTHERGVEPKKLCDALAQYLRDLLYAGTIGEAPADRSDDERKELRALSARTTPVQLTRLFDLVLHASREVGYAAQPLLALEVALLTGVHLAPAQDLAALAARLEQLAGGANAVAPSPTPRGSEVRSPTPQRPIAPAPARASPPAVRAGAPTEDLARQVEAMARGRSAARGRSTAPSPPPTSDDDDEPPPPSDEHVPSVARELARPLPSEELPGGCATGECIGEPAPRAPTSAGERDDPTLAAPERWRRAVEGVRARTPMLATLLAEGRLLWLRPGEVAIGFAPAQRFHKKQLEAGELHAQVLEELAAWFGVPMRLRLDDVKEDTSTSLADDERRARDERMKRVRTEARESDAVRAVQSILVGEIDDIEVLDER